MIEGRPDVKYLLPNYARGDRYLRALCRRTHRFTASFRVSSDPCADTSMLTYGYLGVIARHTRRCQRDPSLQPLTHVLIADHGFGPPDLKHTLYRFAATGRRLRGLHFGDHDLLAPRFRDAIYTHLKTLQGATSLELMGRMQAGGSKQVALLVEPAPVLTALQLDPTFDPTQHAQTVQRKAAEAGLGLFRSYKRVEISLSAEGERLKTLREGERRALDPRAIGFASCPTSMLAVQLMLQGIPVELSPLHPLVDQLGLQIPSMGRAEALERLYDVICRTTVCVPRLRRLEQRTRQFNPADVLKPDAVALKP